MAVLRYQSTFTIIVVVARLTELVRVEVLLVARLGPLDALARRALFLVAALLLLLVDFFGEVGRRHPDFALDVIAVERFQRRDPACRHSYFLKARSR